MKELFFKARPIWGLLELIATLVELNVLWLVFSAPIVTVPPATMALTVSLHQWTTERTDPSLAQFFKNFRDHASRSYQLSWPIILAGLMLAMEAQFFAHRHAPADFLLMSIVVGFSFCLVAFAPWVLPMATLYPNLPLLKVYAYILHRAKANPGISILMIGMCLSSAAISLLFPFSIALATPLGLFAGAYHLARLSMAREI